jgi:hypothetical protein
MHPMLMSYFDLGVSYGLGDSVLKEDRQIDAHGGLVGFSPAIGHGAVATVSDSELRIWREEAGRQAHRTVMEIGRVGSRGEFDAELEQLVRTQPIERCTLRVYPVGIASLVMSFYPLTDTRFLRGLLACFEYAGYRPPVARAMHCVAVKLVAGVVENVASMASPLTKLTSRDLPPVDSWLEEDYLYEEQLLFPSFTKVLVCTEAADADALKPALTALEPLVEDRPIVKFEDHGQLHCGWAVCAVVAKRVATPQDPGEDDPKDQVRRMLGCVELAQVHYGVCDAFERLFLDEIDEQVGGYLRRTTGGRSPDDLNRLRNLALAVVSLTAFSRVTETDEDQRYFDWFEGASQIQQKRDFIRDSAEMLYAVSEAETQSNRSRREAILSGIVLLLTTATLLSVGADMYDFVREQEPLIADRSQRLLIVVQALVALGAVVLLLVYLVSRPHPIRSWRARRAEPDWRAFDDPARVPPR